MAEKESGGSGDAEGRDILEDGTLQEHLAHWAEVLDRWVKGVDMGMGRQDGEAADAASLNGTQADAGSQPATGSTADPPTGTGG
ncbi:MAG: hypothetical protein M3082_18710 [Candidatus Dormibacteraeota bacterium]|nr:hypothetical protein [Candidatus Dormibacteraeota bacterium]